MKSEPEIIKQLEILCAEFKTEKLSKEDKIAYRAAIFMLEWVLNSDEFNASLKEKDKKK